MANEAEPIPGIPANMKGKTYTALLELTECFAKEKPGATNDEHIALGLMFLCNLRDGDQARRLAFEADVLERLGKLERRTSSTEFVTLHGEVDARGFGKSYRVKWAIPYDAKPEQAATGNGATPVGVYVGDGHPALRRAYEPEGEPEEHPQ